VLPAYGIAARFGGRRAGLLAGLLTALNPFLIWYSQEARMFMPATTFGLVGLYGVMRMANGEAGHQLSAISYRPSAIGHQLSAGLLIVVGFTAALYTYLFSAFLLPVAGAWLLLSWWLSRREPGAAKRLGEGIVALAIVGLLFWPLARSAWAASGAESAPGRAFEGMGPALWRLLQVYTLGWPRWPAQTTTWATIGAAALAVVGVLRGRWKGIGGPGFWLTLPLLLGGLLLARDRTVFAEARYFIFLVPALCLAWGRALAWLWGRWRAVGLLGTALVVGVTVTTLLALWSPQNRREAWREAAALVQRYADPRDAVLVQADYVHVAFERYFHGPQPVYFPFTDRLTDPAQVDPPLQGLAAYNAVWLVQSHHQELDPGNLVAGWFGARYPLITEAYPAGIAIKGFLQRYRIPALPPDAPRLPAETGFGAGIDPALLACVYDRGPLPARDDLYHPPSGWVHVTTYWTTAQPISDDIFPQIRLVDAAGQVWGERLDRRGDASHIWPTSHWLPGEVVRVDYDVNLNPVTPAGTYRLIVEAPGVAAQAVCGDVRITNLP
jgi:hypothetical protein